MEINKHYINKGFTLPEAMVYVAVLSVITISIGALIIWSIKISGKIKAENETMQNAGQAIDIMAYEIKEAKNIYTPTSVLDAHPGQLSLETTHDLPVGEKTAYLDIYLCGGQLCFKREGQTPVALTSNKTTITNLTFSRVLASTTETVQINLGLKYNTPSSHPEWQASTTLTTTVTVKGY